MQMKYIVVALLIFLVSPLKSQSVNVSTSDYLLNFKEWEKDLHEGRTNYLKLAALCRMKDKETTIGTSDNCDCIIDATEGAGKFGSFEITTDKIIFSVDPDLTVYVDGAVISTPYQVALSSYGDSETFTAGRFSWKVITRGGKYYIRAYDDNNPAIGLFPGFTRFPLTNEFIFDANFEYFKTPEINTVDSRIGVKQEWSFIGRLSFEYDEKEYTLDVSENGFTMVRDVTSGEETYGGGRYMYIDLPKEDGNVLLDFNRLYNPPCAFSEYTTCLLPPVQNTLDFKLSAGEKIAPAPDGQRSN